MANLDIICIKSKRGPVWAAQGPDGLVALSLFRYRSRLDQLLARRRPGWSQRRVPPEQIEAGRQLLAYLAGKRRTLDVPLDLAGFTPFRRAVSLAVAAIPYGNTRSYGEIARQAGSPRAARAVGQIMASNPLPLFVPCHRVLGSGGALTGFGSGLDNKQALLALEQGGPALI